MYPVSVRGLGEFKYTSATREEIKRNFYSPQVSKRGLETHVKELNGDSLRFLSTMDNDNSSVRVEPTTVVESY